MNKIKTLIILMILFLSTIPYYSASAVIIENQDKENKVSICSSGRYAVVIGTSYLASSTWAKNSAEKFSEVIQKNEYWTEIKLLSGEKATKDNILDGIDWLSEKDGEDAVLLFYIIGHTQKTLLGHFFKAEDDEYISDLEFQTHFAKISSKSKLVLIFDTCYSGRMDTSVDKIKSKNMFLNYFLNNQGIINLIKQKLTFNLVSIDKEPLNEISIKNDDNQNDYAGLFQDLVKLGRIVMTACKVRQLSWRGPGDMSAFTYYLREAINKGENTSEDTFNYAKEPTHNYVLGEHGALQTPQMSDKCSGDVRIV